MLGGSDSFSNMIYARGNPQDYDVWAAMGAAGWSYEDVLPYFIKSENNRNSFFKTSRELNVNGSLCVCLSSRVLLFALLARPYGFSFLFHFFFTRVMHAMHKCGICSRKVAAWLE